jgi:hypothetical protein
MTIFGLERRGIDPLQRHGRKSMKTARSIKTTTALRNALAAAGLDADDTAAIIRALRDAAKSGTATTGATIQHYPDGWLPNSYRWRAPGRQVTVAVSPFGVEVSERQIDRKRSGGYGPRVTVRALRPGMTHGTLVANI